MKQFFAEQTGICRREHLRNHPVAVGMPEGKHFQVGHDFKGELPLVNLRTDKECDMIDTLFQLHFTDMIVTGNLEKEYLDAIDDLNGQKIDIMQLYGTQGIGEVAKYAYVGQATATPSDVGGADEILEMAVTIIPNTAAKKVTDDFVVVDNKDGTFTVTKKA